MVGEFSELEFDDRVSGMFRFEFRRLSNASFEVLKRKLERLADEGAWNSPSSTACRRRRTADGGVLRLAAAVDGVDGEWLAVAKCTDCREPMKQLFARSAPDMARSGKVAIVDKMKTGAGPFEQGFQPESQCCQTELTGRRRRPGTLRTATLQNGTSEP